MERFPGYKIYEEYNPDQYKTSVQKKVEKVLGEAQKEKGRAAPELLEFRELIEQETESLRNFFGHDIEVPPLPPEITPERYDKWKEMGLELHYLPAEEMKKDSNFPGWKKKPEDWFYEKLKAKEIAADSATLSAAWMLIDGREKPNYKDGKQALPGKNRARSGVCGAGIKWAGLDMVRRLQKGKGERGKGKVERCPGLDSIKLQMMVLYFSLI